jgi:hypothetical protein
MLAYQFSDLVLTSTETLPELPIAAAGAPEVRIDWAPIDRLTVRPSFAAWLTPSGGEWLKFADDDDAFLLTFSDIAQFRVSREAARVTVCSLRGTPAATLRHLLLNQVMPLVLSRRGRLVLHGSAISWRGGVAAFIGRSGAGKSTLAAACAAAGASIVTDDCLVLRRDGARWLAVPCDAGVRLWPSALELLGWPAASGAGLAHYTNKRRMDPGHPGLPCERDALPLIRVYKMLRPGDDTPIGVLRGQDAMMSLASELFRLDVRDAAESRRQFEAISALASDVPMEAPGRQAPGQAASAVLCRM